MSTLFVFTSAIGTPKVFAAYICFLFSGNVAADSADNGQSIQLDGEGLQGWIVGNDLDLARMGEGNSLQALDLRLRITVADRVHGIGGHLVL